MGRGAGEEEQGQGGVEGWRLEVRESRRQSHHLRQRSFSSAVLTGQEVIGRAWISGGFKQDERTPNPSGKCICKLAALTPSAARRLHLSYCRQRRVANEMREKETFWKCSSLPLRNVRHVWVLSLYFCTCSPTPPGGVGSPGVDAGRVGARPVFRLDSDTNPESAARCCVES